MPECIKCHQNLPLSTLMVEPNQTFKCECWRFECYGCAGGCDVCKEWKCDYHLLRCSTCGRQTCPDHEPSQCPACYNSVIKRLAT